MFTRTNVGLQVTVFDSAGISTLEKKVLWDKITEMHTDSLTSFSDEKMVTRFVLPVILNESNIYPNGCCNTIQRCIFNDILGIQRDPNGDSYTKTQIINKQTFSSKRFKRIKGERSNDIVKEQYNITETKTRTLIERHHKKLLLKSGKSIEQYNNDPNECKQPDPFHDALLREAKKDDAFDVNKTVLNKVDKIMFVDTVYTVSELNIVMDQWSALHRFTNLTRVDNGYNSYSIRDTNVVTNLKKVYGKYKVKASSAWQRIEQNESSFDSGYSNRLSLESLLKESEKEEELTNNIFIPVTFVFFIAGGKTMFNSTNQIVIEEHQNNIPQFFIAKTIVASPLGYPHKTTEYSAQQEMKEQSSIVPDEEMYSLNVTLVSIPANISNRLLKSKIKAVQNIETTTQPYGDYEYDIPKSILELGLMSSFHFFTVEQEERIKTNDSTQAFKYYCTRFDGNVDLSYYTHNIHNWLVNKFASDTYYDVLGLNEIAYHPKTLFVIKDKLSVLYEEIEKRQAKLSYIFNDTKTLLSKEMFLYEKALFLTLYSLNKIGMSMISSRNETSKNHINGVFIPEIEALFVRNNYMVTYDILSRLGRYDVEMCSTGMVRRAYLLENMYFLVQNNTTEDIIKVVENSILESNQAHEQQVHSFVQEMNLHEKITKYLQHTERDIRNLMNELERVFRSYKRNPKIFEILTKQNSNEIFPIILTIIKTDSFRKKFKQFIRMYGLTLYYTYVSFNKLILDKDSINASFLIDSADQEKIIQMISNYNDVNDSNFKFISKHLVDNAAATKNTDFKLFTKQLIEDFCKNYISSINTVK